MKRILTLTLAVILVSGALAGCGGTTANNQTTVAVTAQESTAPTTTAETTEAQKEPATLNFVTVKSISKEFVDNLIADYSQESGNKVNIEYYAEKYDVILPTKIASGEIPDVLQVFPTKTMIGFKGLGSKGYLLDLTNEAFIQEYMDSINLQNTFDGKIYSIATTQALLPVLYNKKLFAKAGIEKTPTNLDEFWAACEKLKAAGIAPVVPNAKENGWFFEVFSIAPSVVFAKDMDWQKKRDKGEVQWNSEPWQKTLGIVNEMYTKGYFMDKPLSIGYEDGMNYFLNSKGAMWFVGTWEVTNLISKGGDGFELGAFFFPGNAAGEPLVYPSSVGELFAASATTKYPEAAKSLLAYFTKKNKEISTEFGGLPTCKGVKQDAIAPPIEEILPVMESNKSYTFLNNEWPAGFDDFCKKGAQAILSGKMTIEEDLKQADIQFDAAYKKAQEASK